MSGNWRTLFAWIGGFMLGIFLPVACGPGHSLDKRHYDCGGNEERIMAAVKSGQNVYSARLIYCREIFPPCKDSTNGK